MKRLILLLVVLLLPCSALFAQKKDLYRVRTVVIDPGHGGIKPGARGSRSLEKDITLSVATKFGKLIQDNYPDVKVIFTRTTDVDISLAERAHIANRNKADLFISVHANSHPTSTPTGVETFVMGLSESKANLEVAKKENADILLEADYKNNADYSGFDPNAPETYVMLAMFQNAFIDKSLNFAQAIQNQYKQNLKTINRGVKQAELYVLYKTTCPSVLTEIGFISNPAEESFMLSDQGQAKIAVSLFNAFMTYKASEEGTAKLSNPVINLEGYGDKAAKEEPAKEPVEEPAGKPVAAQPEQPAPVAVAESAKPAPEVVEAPVQPVTVAEPAKPAPEVVAEATPAPEPAEAAAPAKADTVVPVEVPASAAITAKPTPSVALPKPVAESKPAPKPEPKPASPKPSQTSPDSKPSQTSKPSNPSTPGKAGIVYRVQFCSAQRQLKVGDPDLQGIKDIHYVKNGKYYVYSAGDYATVQEARQRCKKIQTTTSFRDAFVIAIYRGERISLEQAAQIESKKKTN